MTHSYGGRFEVVVLGAGWCDYSNSEVLQGSYREDTDYLGRAEGCRLQSWGEIWQAGVCNKMVKSLRFWRWVSI